MRRAGVSIASNIAEGYGRGSTQDYLRFLRFARGSLYEVDTQLQFAADLGFLTGEQHAGVQALVDESGRIVVGLIKSLEMKVSNPGSSA